MDPTEEEATYLNFDRIGNPQRSPSVNAHVVASLTGAGAGNPNSAHGLGAAARRRYTAAQQAILACFPAFDAVELLPGGGSSACRRAVEDSINFHPSSKLKKDVVLISQMEHKCIHTYATRHLTERGYFVVKVPSTALGAVSVPAFDALLREYGARLALVSVLSVGNETGVIQPIEELYRRTKAVSEGIVFHSDACHGLQLPSACVPDILTFSAYKLGGDHTGVLLRKAGVALADAYFGTPDVLSAETTALALRETLSLPPPEAAAAAAALLAFKKRLCGAVEEVLGRHGVSYACLSPVGASIHSTLAFVTSCLPGDALVQALSGRGVLASAGSACAAARSGAVGSYVVKSMGYSNKATFNLLRFTYSAAEIGHLDEVVAALEASVGKLASLIGAPQRAARLSTNVMEPCVCRPVLRGGVPVHASAALLHPLLGPEQLAFNKIRVCPDEAYLKGSQRDKFVGQVQKDIERRIADSGMAGVSVGRDNLSIVLTRTPDPDSSPDGSPGPAPASSLEGGSGALPEECLSLLGRVPGVSLYYPAVSFANTPEHGPLLYSCLATLYERARGKHRAADSVPARVSARGLVSVAPPASPVSPVDVDSEVPPPGADADANAFTFRITVKFKGPRRYLGRSQQELNMLFGQYIVDRFGGAVDLQRPSVTLSVDISSSAVDVFDSRAAGLAGLPIGSEGAVACLVAADNARRSLVGVWLMSCRGCRVQCYVTRALAARPALLAEFKRCCRVVNPYVGFTELPPLSPLAGPGEGEGGAEGEGEGQGPLQRLQAAIAQELVVVEPPDSFAASGGGSDGRSRASSFLHFCSMWKMVGIATRKMFFSASMPFGDEEVLRMIGAWQLGSSLASTPGPCPCPAGGEGGGGGGTLGGMAWEALTAGPLPAPLHSPPPLPAGTRVLGLLSGGIDSPVAMAAGGALGLHCSYVHFSSSIDKIGAVSDIVGRLRQAGGRAGGGAGGGRHSLYVVAFQRLQDEIAASCPESYRTIMYKIFFVKIATALAARLGCAALLTGNSLGQVASQTPRNLLETDLASALPALSPLLGLSKAAITARAQAARLDTFALSTSGCTDDCCVMYLPTNPVLSAKAHRVREALDRIPHYMDLIEVREVAVPSVREVAVPSVREVALPPALPLPSASASAPDCNCPPPPQETARRPQIRIA
jgi:adenylyl- and sulfurtransferase ThiI/cysteine sulfinate desulfinase/cysteine desulfurase-like protein